MKISDFHSVVRDQNNSICLFGHIPQILLIISFIGNQMLISVVFHKTSSRLTCFKLQLHCRWTKIKQNRFNPCKGRFIGNRAGKKLNRYETPLIILVKSTMNCYHLILHRVDWFISEPTVIGTQVKETNEWRHSCSMFMQNKLRDYKQGRYCWEVSSWFSTFGSHRWLLVYGPGAQKGWEDDASLRGDGNF